MTRSAVIVSDVHVSCDHGHSTGEAILRLLEEYPEADLVLAGDIFDLSLDPPNVPVGEGVRRILSAQPEMLKALRNHVQRGGQLSIVPGNHDAALAHPTAAVALRSALGSPDDRQVKVRPWFYRRGPVHIEHGNLYDADNSFAHPLADHDPRTEPLGTALMRRFVGPNDAIFFAHAHRTTPAGGLKLALEKWGLFAPVVIARYFAAALGLVRDAAIHKGTRRREREVGNLRLPDRAREEGIEPELVRRLLEVARVPTHESARDTFMRLYFDRVLSATFAASGAAAVLGTGLFGLTTGRALSPELLGIGALATATSAGYLSHNVITHRSRYGGNIVEEIGSRAHLVREAVGAELVVFGHTHVPIFEPGYVNLGSFGFDHKARPYLCLDGEGRPEQKRLRPSG